MAKIEELADEKAHLSKKLSKKIKSKEAESGSDDEETESLVSKSAKSNGFSLTQKYHFNPALSNQ